MLSLSYISAIKSRPPTQLHLSLAHNWVRVEKFSSKEEIYGSHKYLTSDFLKKKSLIKLPHLKNVFLE